ncbi:MAG: DUF2141 domain-containing protein [Myxococcales bacterium]|nr:DUF2141 domain-containing protein [Myxococcales bacterium]
MMRWLCLASWMMFLAAPAAARGESAPRTETSSVVRFEIRTKHNRGKVRCGLYRDEKTWLGKKYAFKDTAVADDFRAVCIFEDVPPGRYAASAYHDEDDDSKFDKNFLGIPTEDFTFSSGARAGLGPPGFDDAAFLHEGGMSIVRGKM